MFCADARMIIDYGQFGDVVSFDTTYKINKANRPFAVFVGLNHHREIVIFGLPQCNVLNTSHESQDVNIEANLMKAKGLKKKESCRGIKSSLEKALAKRKKSSNTLTHSQTFETSTHLFLMISDSLNPSVVYAPYSNRFVSFQVRLEDMTSVVSSQCNWSLGIQEHLHRGRFNKIPWSGYFGPHFPSKGLISYYNQHLGSNYYQSVRRRWPVFSSAVDDVNDNDPDDSDDGKSKEESAKGEFEGVNGEMVRENLERMVGTDDSAFSGLDLATLIRNKYGRSYDVQLIKKEFLGRNLLALNVMWKYMEQRSFPLTEEEYILRLDDVANTLKCWGAVSHIRNSLAKLKERPRIGKAVSIFIDMDESGGRANEWIYK
ncbi:hypothetical protein LWI28_018829 [Acer negundo]|nr:hypothetical protein LWI28_018829 [Acer negundo]